MRKTWPNVNPRFGPKPVPTDFEAHAVSTTAFVVMTYTHKARVRDAEQSGMLDEENRFPLIRLFSYLISALVTIDAKLHRWLVCNV